MLQSAQTFVSNWMGQHISKVASQEWVDNQVGVLVERCFDAARNEGFLEDEIEEYPGALSDLFRKEIDRHGLCEPA